MKPYTIFSGITYSSVLYTMPYYFSGWKRCQTKEYFLVCMKKSTLAIADTNTFLYCLDRTADGFVISKNSFMARQFEVPITVVVANLLKFPIIKKVIFIDDLHKQVWLND